MARKPFPWKKLTPAQLNLMERLAAAAGGLAYRDLEYFELLAFEELRKLGFADMRAKGRSRLAAVLTDKGMAMRADNYQTDQVIVRVTGPQVTLLRHLNDAPVEDSVGEPMNSLPGTMLDVCRRMFLRGWVEPYEGWDGSRWAKLSPAGREVLESIDALHEAIAEMAKARRRRNLQ